jgi:glycosyltransferase involved in cell wall biosynthesis
MPDLTAHVGQPRASDLNVTLVVPLRDEELTVEALMRTVAAQSRPPDAVIFVDAGSRDATSALVTAACASRPGWSLVSPGPATPGRARNVGIETANTEWIALTDAGIELDRYWLERLVRVAAADTQVEVVWGHYEPAPDGWFTACARLAYVTPAGPGATGPVRAHSIASCLLRRTVWQQAGLFPDLRAAEDRIFMRRVAALGIRTAVAPEAIAWWHLQPGFGATFSRFRRYSEVNVAADEQGGWHYPVARMYLAGVPFIVLAAIRRRRWALVPLVAAAARVGRAIWRGREGRGMGWAANPARFLTVGAIVATVDAATFWGWRDAVGPIRLSG